LQIPSHRVIGNITELVVIVCLVDDAVRVVAVLPDGAGILFSNGKGKAAFDELGGLLNGLCWRDENVNVVRHNDVTVQKKTSVVSIAKDRL
jgi:hypothetical protein